MKAAFALVFCASIYAQQASIEGLTVDAISQAPLAGVHVRLVTGSSSGMTGVYGAISDREGRFSIATIRPGTYIIFPERTGFLYAVPRGDTLVPNIAIRPGERLTGLKIEMSPRAILSGKVVNEFGDPLQGIYVQTVAISEKEGSVIVLSPPLMTTDDRGEFRVSTVQGRYYLLASTGNINNNNERAEVRTDGTSASPYSATFYPSSVIKDRATPVEAVGGKEVSGLEVRLSRQKGPSISGTVSGFPDRSRPSVVLRWAAGEMSSVNNITTDADGKFSAPAQPGFYQIWAASYGQQRLASRVIEFQMGTADVGNVDLRWRRSPRRRAPSSSRETRRARSLRSARYGWRRRRRHRSPRCRQPAAEPMTKAPSGWKVSGWGNSGSRWSRCRKTRT